MGRSTLRTNRALYISLPVRHSLCEHSLPWFADEYKGLKERSTFCLIFVVPCSSFCWCPSFHVSYCLTQSHSTSQEEQGRLPWFSVFLRTPEPYFGEVSHLHAVSVPFCAWGLPFVHHGPHQDSVLLGHSRLSASKLARSGHARCAEFLCLLTCSIVPWTSHIKYKFKNKIISDL